ncbi:MAG: hypothetical protein ACN6N0_08785 [Microvirgula sp.]
MILPVFRLMAPSGTFCVPGIIAFTIMAVEERTFLMAVIPPDIFSNAEALNRFWALPHVMILPPFIRRAPGSIHTARVN